MEKRRYKGSYSRRKVKCRGFLNLFKLTISSSFQTHQVSDEYPGFDVPKLDTTIITAGHHKVLCELKTGDGTLMLVLSMKSVDTVALLDIPDLHVHVINTCK